MYYSSLSYLSLSHPHIITLSLLGQLEESWARMQRDYYDQRASLIQAQWRGYRTRKHVLDFYKRKAYLQSLEEMNGIVRY